MTSYSDALDDAVSLDDPEVEPTHAVFDRYGFDVVCTPIDKLMANEAMGFDMADAMEGVRD